MWPSPAEDRIVYHELRILYYHRPMEHGPVIERGYVIMRLLAVATWILDNVVALCADSKAERRRLMPSETKTGFLGWKPRRECLHSEKRRLSEMAHLAGSLQSDVSFERAL